MPTAPSKIRFHPDVKSDDLEGIHRHNPDHVERILNKINEWRNHIKWGRTPQDRLTYLTGSGPYNFYREYVGKSGYRIIYEISGDVMTVVAVLPKGDDTYDLEELKRRMDQY